MPLIPPEILDCAVFMYASRADAERGEMFGGSGFLLAVPDDPREPISPDGFVDRILAKILIPRGDPKRAHFYLVTNAHVAGGGCRFARINTRQGGARIFDLRSAAWETHKGGDEVAVCPFPDPDSTTDRVRAVPLNMLLAGELISELQVGPGDNLFMIGRFVQQSGHQRNFPTARFGHLSAMPLEPIQARGINNETKELECYLVEAYSFSGYSGSPVFLTIAPWELDHSVGLERRRQLADMEYGGLLWMLGINWGHLPISLQAKTSSNDHLTVTINAGMMCVAPAQKIIDVLRYPTLVSLREEDRKRWKSEGAATLD
jgi:hypothetical protein